jgi:hypothetical protein
MFILVFGCQHSGSAPSRGPIEPNDSERDLDRVASKARGTLRTVSLEDVARLPSPPGQGGRLHVLYLGSASFFLVEGRASLTLVSGRQESLTEKQLKTLLTYLYQIVDVADSYDGVACRAHLRRRAREPDFHAIRPRTYQQIDNIVLGVHFGRHPMWLEPLLRCFEVSTIWSNSPVHVLDNTVPWTWTNRIVNTWRRAPRWKATRQLTEIVSQHTSLALGRGATLYFFFADESDLVAAISLGTARILIVGLQQNLNKWVRRVGHNDIVLLTSALSGNAAAAVASRTSPQFVVQPAGGRTLNTPPKSDGPTVVNSVRNLSCPANDETWGDCSSYLVEW